MTIRRYIDAADANSTYSAFEDGIEAAPEGTFSFARNLKFEIGEACDDFLSAMRRIGAKTDNCDGIREIEALMFDMVRRESDSSEIRAAIGLGYALDNSHFDRVEVLRRVKRDKTFLATRAEWLLLGMIADDAGPLPGVAPMTYKQDADALLEGPGDMWMVRVVSDLDDIDYVDLEVRAVTMEVAAEKAVAHARRHPDMYFETAPKFDCHAKRHDIYRIEEEGEVDDSEERYAGSNQPWPGVEA